MTHFAAISKIIADPDPFIAQLVAKAAAVGIDGFDIDYEPQNDEKVRCTCTTPTLDSAYRRANEGRSTPAHTSLQIVLPGAGWPITLLFTALTSFASQFLQPP